MPNGVEKKLTASAAWQYLLMIIAGIPLIEIGLFLGGSSGLQLSRIGSGLQSLTKQLTHWVARFAGYIPITLFGLASFSTNATLTIQQFKSIPVLTWFLMPSATLGIDLINIVSGIKLWDQILIAISTKVNKDKALFLNYMHFLEKLPEKVKTISAEETAALILNLDSETQQKIMQFIPSIKDKEVTVFIDALTNILQKKTGRQKGKNSFENFEFLPTETNDQKTNRFDVSC